MLDTSTAWADAVTADARRALIRAIVDITAPDIAYGSVVSQSAASWSQPSQLYDRTLETVNYATMERNRWTLDGSAYIMPDDYSSGVQVGYVSNILSGDDGTFPTAQYVELQFSGVTLLQACSVYFSNAVCDGVAEDFVIEVKQGGTAYHTETVTGNTATSISISGFSVSNADAIRVTVTKWSLPGRRMRVCEIVVGTYEVWGNDDVLAATITQEANVACVALPYGTCQLVVDNSDRRFEPRNKTGIFKSIEERQGVVVALGVEIDGAPVYQPVGVYYQFALGWATGDNDMSVQWNLVDIIGLLSQRQYIPPGTLPTTVEGWVASIVGQLGANFASRYTVDASVASTSMTVRAASDVESINCGDLLCHVCMAAGAFPRADAETGYLAVEPLWSSGAEVTLDNLNGYPVMLANDDVAALIFTLNDGNNTVYTVSGTATASGNTLSINNPFIKNSTEALAAAKFILSAYGGNRITTNGRGNPASEIGDVDRVELDASTATAGRRIQQTLELTNGVLSGCTSTLLQADGSLLYENSQTFTQSGAFTVPSGVTSIRVILVGHGADGGDGTNGTYGHAGTDGADGSGGKVWTGTFSVTAGQSLSVTIGSTNTTLGSYSSASGSTYDRGYVDIATGEVYGRPGVKQPKAGSGDGGRGGAGGRQGNREKNPDGGYYYNVIPGQGEAGVPGASGCAIIYWAS